MSEQFGKFIILIGLITIVIGILFYFGGKLGIRKLPGDIFYQKGNFTFYFPIVTCIILSIIITIILNLFRK